MNVSWEQYFRYTECPLAYMWDYHTPRKPSGTGSSDTQYLVKGNTVQDLVGRWLQEPTLPWTSDPTRHIAEFLEKASRDCLRKHWLDDQKRGSPNAEFLDLLVEIQVKLTLNLPMLRGHILKQCQGLPPTQIYKELPVEAKDFTTQLYDPTLTAVIDVLVETPQGEWIIYEGKNTKYTKKVAPNQLWWQAGIVFEQKSREAIPALDHFMVLYHTNEIRHYPIFSVKRQPLATPVRCITEEVVGWRIGERARNLLGILEGNAKATPDKNVCRLCHHQFHCPDRWSQKSVLEQPRVRGVTTNIL